jgi:hypothetical protein
VRACDFFASLFRALRSPGFKKMRLERRGGCSSSLFLLLLSLTTEKDARARALVGVVVDVVVVIENRRKH